MILGLHIVIGILLIILIIRHFLDYRELRKEKNLNTDLLLNLYAYNIFYGDLDNLKIQKARSAFHDLVIEEQKKYEK